MKSNCFVINYYKLAKLDKQDLIGQNEVNKADFIFFLLSFIIHLSREKAVYLSPHILFL